MADRRVTWPDLGLTAVLLFVGLMGTGPAAANQGRPAPVLSYVLVVAACLPIAVWRSRTTWAFTLTGTATMIYIGLGYAYGPILFPLALASYALAVRSPIRRAVASVAALLAASVVAVGVGVVTGEREWLEFVSVGAWVLIPAAVGVAVKARRDAAAEVRAEQARRATSEERLRLAQEVHDVVGHGLAVIAMQAGVALRVLDRDPARVRAALEAIRATSKESLDGVRAELEALRCGSVGPAAPRRPAAGLAELPGLVERIRASGLPVRVEVDAAARELPAEVDQAAYRIVQESLTNVLRHGGPAATADVRIVRDSGALRVDVSDTGRGAAAESGARSGARSGEGGLGIAGMRARAEALGGGLDAEPRPEGGFTVHAVLPIAERVPAPGEPG